VSFYNAENDIQGLTSLLFSIFLITQLFSTMSMLIIPRFSHGRNVFEARERNSMTYSWVAFVAAHIVVEMAWLTVIAALLFVCWYYPTGMHRNGSTDFSSTERGGIVFILVWLFCLWASTLSQVFAAGIELPETALQMATLCFWLSIVFCG
jgi:ABC-type multidrug transport system permease subunit